MSLQSRLSGFITRAGAEFQSIRTALDGKANTHSHPYASDSHNHGISDVTGLQAALDAAGGRGTSMEKSFVLNENMTAGDFALLREDGKIEKVFGVKTEEDYTQSNFVPESGSLANAAIAADPFDENRFACAYWQGSSPYGWRVALIDFSGDTPNVTVTQVTTGSVNDYSQTHIEFDPFTPNKILLTAVAATVGLKVYAGTISGTAITFGTPVTLTTATLSAVRCVHCSYNPNEKDHFVVTYEYGGDMTVTAGSVSGNTITLGTPVQKIDAGQTYWTHITWHPNYAGMFTMVSRNDVATWKVSGTTVSLIRLSMWSNTSDMAGNFFHIPNTKDRVFFTYRQVSTNYAMACFGTLNEYGVFVLDDTRLTIHSESYDYWDAYMGYSNQSGAFSAMLSGEDSATDDNRLTPIVIKDDAIQFTGDEWKTTYANGVNVACASGYGTRILTHQWTVNLRAVEIPATITNLNPKALMGVLQESGTTGQSKPVLLLGGIDENQTGLTPAKTYYLSGTGELTTEPRLDAVEVGKALSTTTIMLNEFN